MTQKPIKNRGLVMLNQPACEELAKDKRIGGDEFRVFYALLSMMDYEDSVQISQADLGKIIGMKQQKISTATKTLIEIDILRSIEKPGQTARYILNPYYVIRGMDDNVVPIKQKWHGDES